MDGVGPGTVLAGRYHAQTRVRVGPHSTTWQALDETLERPVSLTVVDRDHPRGKDVVDAARRAAGVEDPRLQRVLDVGVEDGITYVVYEWVGADSLTDIVRSGLPSPEEVRRLVGEAATALEAARGRGLHHLALTPDSLLRGHDGPVTVTGLAVDSVLAGASAADPDQASRQDAHALVALLYAGLTGRWPLDPVAGLEPPPHVGSGVPAPSELTAGVPADLDALCVHALRGDDGPADPGRLATQLAPWAAHPVVSTSRTTGTFPIALGAETGPQTAVLPAVGDARSVQAAVNAPRPPAPPAPPAHPPATHVPPPTPEPTPAPAAQPPPAPRTAPAGGFAPPMLPSPADATARPGSGTTWPPLPAVKPTDQPTKQAAPAPLAAPLTAPPAAPPAAPPPAPPPAQAAAQAAAPARPVAPPPAPRSPRLLVDPPEAEPPAPLLPSAPMSRPPAAQTRAVLLVMVAFVLVLSVLAYFGLRSIGSGGGGGGSPTGGTTPSSGASRTTGGPTSSATAPSVGGAVLKVRKASGFDPQGDGSEKDNLAKLAIDSKASTGWTSDTYRSPTWGGLKKGVGLLLDLGSAQAVHSARVTIAGTGATVQLRAVTSPDSLAGSTVLARMAGAQGTFTLTAAQPATTRYVVIWFTTPAQFSDGYRAEVDTVILR